MILFEPAPFMPHPIFRGGHLQTLAPDRSRISRTLRPETIFVDVSDGDQIALHLDEPDDQADDQSGDQPGDQPGRTDSQTPTVLLIHGLTGCHGAPYMIRFAGHFLSLGYRVCRMDMRGFGAAWALSRNLSHAGRSDDVIAALAKLAELTSGDLYAAGISLGGNQLLRAVGRIGSGVDAAPGWIGRLKAVAAVCPPIELARCAESMQRRRMWIYNRYFIRSLLQRAPKLVAERADYQAILQTARPRTLRELDEQFTAPLNGFSDAMHYYDQSSANRVVNHIDVPTLVIASKNDPIVPFDCFSNVESDNVELVSPQSGGHVGFIGPHGRSWLESTIGQFFGSQAS